MKKITMKIEGMHCASCASNLTKSLTKLGAKEINVNVIFGKAFAEVEDGITEEQLRKSVKDVGFELVEIESE
jgi:copper chaperone CopZ